MSQMFDSITDRHRAFIERQQMFFVATAAPDGRVNVSPKGLDSLRVLGANRLVWLNLTGSGNETAAHMLESSRMTIMWCSFDREPLILRAYGTARTVHAPDEGWDELAALFDHPRGERNIFDVHVEQVQTSCGFAVPLATDVRERTLLDQWAAKKSDEQLVEYRRTRNALSIDGRPTGLPGAITESLP